MKKWCSSLLSSLLLTFMLCGQVNAITLKKSDVDGFLANKYIVGDINPDVPVWPLFLRDAVGENQKPVLYGYAFESVDFEPVRGYGGKPINILVCIDTQGGFIEVRLLDHREPLFRSDVGFAKLAGFAAQYIGLSIHHDVQIYDFKAKTARDAKYAALHGVQAGTVSVRAMDRAILQSATSVARAHLEAAKTGTIVGEGNAIALIKGSLYDAPVKPLNRSQMRMSYNKQTGLVYIPTINLCMDIEGIQEDYKRGQFYLSVNFDLGKMGPGGHGGGLKAWDPVKQKEVWFQKNSLPFNSGTMTTASGLVFAGDIQGMFRAFDAKTGKVLWQFNTVSGITAAPMTYTIDGKQYVAVVSGRTQSIPAFFGEVGEKMVNASPEGGTLFVFALN